VKTRKYNQNQKKLDDMTAPLSTVLNPSSESWRRRYQRLGCTATGDIRRRPGIPEYPFFTEHLGNIPSSIFPWGTSVNGVDKVLTIENDHSVENSSLKEGKLNNEALMNSWRLILECCQKVVKDIENVDRVKRPKLQDLLIIVWKAYSIPKPEGVFGRRDFISKHISQSMNIILDQVEAARDVIAYLSDAIYDEDNEGIDIDSLRKLLISKDTESRLILIEIDVARIMLEEALSWQSKLSITSNCEGNGVSSNSEDLAIPRQSLSHAQDLLVEGRLLSLRPKSVVQLEQRIQRAHHLRDQIRQWKKVCIKSHIELNTFSPFKCN